MKKRLIVLLLLALIIASLASCSSSSKDESSEESVVEEEVEQDEPDNSQVNTDISDDSITKLISEVGTENGFNQDVDYIDLMGNDLLIGIDYLGDKGTNDFESYAPVIAEALFNTYPEINLLEILYMFPDDVWEVDYERVGDSFEETYSGYDSELGIG